MLIHSRFSVKLFPHVKRFGELLHRTASSCGDSFQVLVEETQNMMKNKYHVLLSHVRLVWIFFTDLLLKRIISSNEIVSVRQLFYSCLRILNTEAMINMIGKLKISVRLAEFFALQKSRLIGEVNYA